MRYILILLTIVLSTLCRAQELVICTNNVCNMIDTYDDFKQKIGKVGLMMAELEADIYCLQEVQPTKETVDLLVESINQQSDVNYAAINLFNNPSYYHQSVFLYRTDRVKPSGNGTSPYSSGLYNMRLRIQQFTDLANGERFTISNNHFKSYNEPKTLENANNLVTKLKSWSDKRVVIVGDLNSELRDDPCQALVKGGYVEEVESRYPKDYSYYYNNTYTYIDHCFTSTGMHPYVVDAKPWHINVRKPSYSTYAYSDHDPIIVRIKLKDEYDAIEAPTATDGPNDNAIYDMQGRRLDHIPTHGLFIRGGRKYVAR